MKINVHFYTLSQTLKFSTFELVYLQLRRLKTNNFTVKFKFTSIPFTRPDGWAGPFLVFFGQTLEHVQLDQMCMHVRPFLQ